MECKLGKMRLCFLDLSYHVRHRIYVLAGLVRFCPINLNDEGADNTEFLQECEDWCSDNWGPGYQNFNALATYRCTYRSKLFLGSCFNANGDDFKCICKPLPHKLLLVSRAVHDEVSSILYSENKFTVSRSGAGGFSSLHSLSSCALASMVSLSIRLNKDVNDQAASSIGANDQPLVQEWNIIGNRLAISIRKARLRLSVIYDALDCRTAEAVVEPLLRLPTLAECAVRLSQGPDYDLRRLAELAVWQATSRSQSGQPFRFLDLPEELQIKVLSHTDLVAPEMISWVDGQGFDPPVCCKRCTDALEACCCPLQHAAFTSAQCTCWTIPKALFQVNSQLYKKATQVFFSQNSFKVHTVEYPFAGVNGRIPDHNCLIKFLHSLPPNALPHIRSLHCVVSVFGYNDFKAGTASQEYWQATVDFMRCNLTLPGLSLTIEDDSRNGPGNLETGAERSVEEEDEEWELYQRLVEPLAQLHGLRNLYVHFAEPYYDEYVGLRNQRELILEKRVMGEAYDSTARGKYARRNRLLATEKAVKPTIGPDGTQLWPLIWD